MEKHDKAYTILIVPGKASRSYRFSLSQSSCKVLLGCSLILSFCLLGFLMHYTFMFRQVTELASLRSITQEQGIKIREVVGTLSQVGDQINHLGEMNKQIRDMARIGSAPIAFLGVGGTEGMAETENSKILPVIQNSLNTMKIATANQEKSLQEVVGFVKKGLLIWSATPSIFPVNGPITSGYGNRISPFTGEPAMHYGVDLSAEMGTPILASADGTISKVRHDEDGLGKFVEIDHGYGILTRYGHQSKTAVRVGQAIKRGETVGLVGNTGHSVGPHLHYEISVNGKLVDPTLYLPHSL